MTFKSAGFTLMELIVMVTIVAIMGMMVGFYSFRNQQERSHDQEAVTSLRRIQEAERFFRVERDTFYPAAGSEANIGNINTNLKLMLPAGANRRWNFAVSSSGCARATRNGDDNRNWFLIINNDGDPVNVDPGSCP
jgi:Tfp pilus assembly protein PilE